MSTIEKNYTVKFLILFLATFVGIFAIWYTLMREESADWLSSQISHQVSPYVITKTETGLIISNVLLGYGFNLPEGFKTLGSKNLNFFIEEAGEKKCEIKHSAVSGKKIKQAATDNSKIVISLGANLDLIFELVNKSETNDCEKYLLDIKNNFVLN